MKRFTVCLLVALCASPVFAQDWIPLQDGKSLAGWKPAENPQSWTVQDGVFVSGGDRSHLFYVGKVAKVRASWAVLEDLANGLPLPPAFTQARDNVNRDYFGSDYIPSGMKFIKDAIADLPPAMTVYQQTAIGMTMEISCGM